METIHRVYKILVGRYHPDNPHTGDAEKFLRLTQAYETLSNPGRRAAYDLQREPAHTGPLPVFEMKEFLGGVDAEANRRLGILCLLYKRRQINPDRTGLSLLEFESLMAIPREHLLFTVWFLREKRFVRALEGAVRDHGRGGGVCGILPARQEHLSKAAPSFTGRSELGSAGGPAVIGRGTADLRGRGDESDCEPHLD
jgi:curved DNA-binding protein CbpA